jgi:hypothetical protein
MPVDRGMSVRSRLLRGGVVALATAGAVSQPYPVDPADQTAPYAAEVPKTIIELQQFRHSHVEAIGAADGSQGHATLVELNPFINGWLLLTLDRGGDGGRATYHIENPDPRGQHVRLADDGLRITADERDVACPLWTAAPTELQQASASPLPYAPLCEGRLYLRKRVEGRRTDLERVTDFLRDRVWGGDAIVGFVRDHLFGDVFLESANPGAAAEPAEQGPGTPAPAARGAAYEGRSIEPSNLGIRVEGARAGQMVLGRWYRAAGTSGAYLSVMQPQAVAEDILQSYPGRVNEVDAVEGRALDYLVAFDLSELDLGFALGTDHPRVGWSPRPPAQARDDRLPGPDGIGTVAPLITTGTISPALAARTVAAFTGGFKREHGAFKYGDLATRNHGSHYGFIEQGVVFSKLQPGLATLYVLADGTVGMKTWSEDDDRRQAEMRFARQNGVPLIERDAATGKPVPGALVARWGPGNWSGSAAGELRTLRAGACLQEIGERRFLLYGYFSTATPSAMARVFQAYGCSYAMLLDMNALEHTYLALYTRQGDQPSVQHLIAGMSEVDKEMDGQLVPRFIGFPDNRDFFYLFRTEDRP